MGKFTKPRVEYVSDQAYIQKIMSVNLRKDLHGDEEICPWCHGTGIVITNNPYGLSGDPDKRAGIFPYKHQSLIFCQHCYNGIIHRCELCGEFMPKGRLKHDCEQQRVLDCKATDEKERKLLESAQEFPPEALNDFVMCYYDGYPYNNGYVNDWDSFFDWWDSDCEGKFKRPEYVWGTDRIEMSIDAYDIVEEATEELYDGAYDSISNSSIEELQVFLDDWCKHCGVGDTFVESHKSKVRIPWELYKQESNSLMSTPNPCTHTPLNRFEVEATGLPYYFRREEVPSGLITKTQAKLIKKPISESTQPAAYFLSRMNKGYIPLYSCPGEKLKDCNDIRWERMCGRSERE